VFKSCSTSAAQQLCAAATPTWMLLLLLDVEGQVGGALVCLRAACLLLRKLTVSAV